MINFEEEIKKFKIKDYVRVSWVSEADELNTYYGTIEKIQKDFITVDRYKISNWEIVVIEKSKNE